MQVILDTDIGDDIDDAFALALLLRCPELTLAGVTTSITGPRKRSGHVRRMCQAAGEAFERIEVVDGAAGLLATRPRAGLLDRPYHYGQDCAADADAPDGSSKTRFLDMLLGHTGEVLVIGGLTNVGVALAVGGRSVRWRRLAVMAGEFQIAGRKEHNVTCDPESAHLVFASGLPVDVIPWSIGPKVKLLEEDIARLREAATGRPATGRPATGTAPGRPDPLVALLVAWLEAFWQHVPGKTNMYDPMTILALIRPELFTWKSGHVSVELRDEANMGLTRFEESETGPHRVAFDVDADAARAFMVERICSGGGISSRVQ
ncbi:MAG: nucleoside hydrolase [Phycisphaerae bacterium]